MDRTLRHTVAYPIDPAGVSGIDSAHTMILDKLTAQGIRITSITDRLHVIHGNNRGRTPFANAFLVLDKVNVLFDTGCGHDIIGKILSLTGIDRVYVSHSHLDHTAGSRLIQDLSGAEIVVPAEAGSSIAQTELLAVRFVGEPLVKVWMETYPPITGFQDFTIGSTFSHGQEISTGSLRFVALHTPGHLIDHYCLWEPDERILLGFDIDLSPFGPWYGNPESDIPAFRRSVVEIQALPAETYLSSHARPLKTPYIAKRLNAYASFFEERDEQILGLLARGELKGIEEIVRLSPFYSADHSQHDRMLWFGEEQMVKKHLQALLERGLIVQENDLYRIRKESEKEY